MPKMDDAKLDLPNLETLKEALADKPDALALLDAIGETRVDTMESLAEQTKQWVEECGADENSQTKLD